MFAIKDSRRLNRGLNDFSLAKADICAFSINEFCSTKVAQPQRKEVISNKCNFTLTVLQCLARKV